MQPQAFDTYATTYDDHFSNSLIGRAQRTQVYKHLSKHFPGKTKTVLEVNCGTGEDALWLSQKGMQVLATDVSEGMLSIAKQKAGKKNIEFRQLKIQESGSLYPGKYDLIFSNFGGLNCLDQNELKQFKNDCHLLQNPSDKLAFVIMSERCLWERFYYKFKGDVLREKRRQNKSGTETEINGVRFRTFYYSPRSIRELFGEHYRLVTTKPIGLFVAPSYLEAYFAKRRSVFKLLILLDTFFGNFSFLSNYADHYLIILEKK